MFLVIRVNYIMMHGTMNVKFMALSLYFNFCVTTCRDWEKRRYYTL